MPKHVIEGYSFDAIFRELLEDLSENPQHVCSPRGSKVKENLAVTLILTNPRARLLTCTKRNTNYGFAVGEFLWYWQGKNDLETMVYYNKRMKDYSNDGVTLNSAYGWRLKQDHLRPNADATQWKTAIKTLLQDSDSRRCVLHINQPDDQYDAVTVGSKDVPCTLSLQFFIRDNRLDLHVHMRSNDVMWGLTYDLFSFTLFQECMLLELQKEEKFKDLLLGQYYHTAGSLHLYEQHFKQAEEIVEEYRQMDQRQPPQEPLHNLTYLESVAEIEQDLRVGEYALIPTTGLKVVCPTSHWMVRQLEEHRKKRDAEALNRST